MTPKESLAIVNNLEDVSSESSLGSEDIGDRQGLENNIQFGDSITEKRKYT
ncbi:MAG: hypothetical protein ACK53Y_04380 [bacterium]